VILSTDDLGVGFGAEYPPPNHPYVVVSDVAVWPFLGVLNGPLIEAVAVSVTKVIRCTYVLDTKEATAGNAYPPPNHPYVKVPVPAASPYWAILRKPRLVDVAVSVA
jgi:hypothetical protein